MQIINQKLPSQIKHYKEGPTSTHHAMPDFIDTIFDKSYSVYSYSKGKADNAVTSLCRSAETAKDWAVERLPESVATKAHLVKPILVRKESHQERLGRFLFKYKYPLLGVSAVFTGYGYYKYQQSFPDCPESAPRKALRLSNGSRYQAVVVVGSPLLYNVQQLVRDLNLRGFIVYVTTRTEQEVLLIEREDSSDIRSLSVNFESNVGIRDCVEKLRFLLNTPVVPFKGAQEHYMHLQSVLLVPDLVHFPIGTMEQTAASEFERCVRGKVGIFVALFNCGLLELIKEQTESKLAAEEFNFQEEVQEDAFTEKPGGFTKLIFISFLASQDRHSAAADLVIDLNRAMYDCLYREMKGNRSSMTQLLVSYDGPKRFSTDGLSESFELEPFNRKSSSDKVHRVLFDAIYSESKLPKRKFVVTSGEYIPRVTASVGNIWNELLR